MDWEVDESRSTPITHVLAPGERSYILEGDTGTRSKGQIDDMVENIHSKSAKLPSRFQDLIDDLTLFHMYGVLDTYDWGGSNVSDLMELYGITERASELKDFTGPVTNPAAPANFGFELGCALHLLLEANDSVNDYQHILWGLLLSEIVNRSRNLQEQQQHLKNLLSAFRERNSNRIAERTGLSEIGEEYHRITQKTQQVAQEILLDTNIELTDGKVTALIMATDPPDSFQDITDEYRRELENILEKNRPKIEYMSHLEDDLLTDARFVQVREPSGVSVEGILERLLKVHWKEEQDGGTSEFKTPLGINEIKKMSEKSQQNVTRALGHLKKEYSGPSWPQHEVVKGSKESAKWQLTGYGKVLAIYLFREGRETQWMYNAIFDRTTIDGNRNRKRQALREALNEIHGETNKPYLSQGFAEGAHVWIDLGDEADPDLEIYDGTLGRIIDISDDDADNVLYRVELKTGDCADFPQSDLHPY